MNLGTRIAELVAQHGSLRAAARVLDVDAGYLSRLASGEKDDPGEALLRRMGLRRVVTYERRLQSHVSGGVTGRGASSENAEGTSASSRQSEKKDGAA